MPQHDRGQRFMPSKIIMGLDSVTQSFQPKKDSTETGLGFATKTSLPR